MVIQTSSTIVHSIEILAPFSESPLIYNIIIFLANINICFIAVKYFLVVYQLLRDLLREYVKRLMRCAHNIVG